MATTTASQSSNAVSIAPFDATWFDADVFADVDGDHKKDSMKRAYGVFQEMNDLEVAHAARERLAALANQYAGERAPLIDSLKRQADDACDKAIAALRPLVCDAVTRLFYAWLHVKLRSRGAACVTVKTARSILIDVDKRTRATFCPYHVATASRYRTHHDADTLKARSIVMALYLVRTQVYRPVIVKLVADALASVSDAIVAGKGGAPVVARAISTTLMGGGDAAAVKSKHKTVAHMHVVLHHIVNLEAQK